MMENTSTTIEFKSIPIQSDLEDLAQECVAYMKTKQFMAKRIHQQQEEIEMLKQNVLFHSGKNIQLYEMLKHLNEQLDLIRSTKITEVQTDKKEKLDLSKDELASSFIIEDNLDSIENKKDNLFNINKVLNESPLSIHLNKNKKNAELIQLRNENLELKKEMENLKIELLDKNLEMNRVKSDKFILFNELNELVMSLRRADIDQLNLFYKKNTSNIFSKHEMPLTKGLKFNILSAQSQIGKILKVDSISKKLNSKQDKIQILNMNNNEIPSTSKFLEEELIDSYYNMLKKLEEEFDLLLDRKLSKKIKSKSFFTNEY